MLILASNTDRLQIVTGSAGKIDVHASWMDNVSGSVVPGRTNTANITAAAITTIVAPPAGGTFRNIKSLFIRNREATSNDVTIVHTDGTHAVEIHKESLQPETSLQYIDEIGWVSDPSVGSSVASGQLVLLDEHHIVPAAPMQRVIFKKGINDTYDQFMVRIWGITAPYYEWVYMRVSQDLGVNWKGENASYQFQYVYTSPPTSPSASYNSQDNKMQLINAIAYEPARVNTNLITIQFAQPWRTGVRHLFLIDSMTIQSNDGIARATGAGEYFGVATGGTYSGQLPFNALQFRPYSDGSSWTGGHFQLYALKK